MNDNFPNLNGITRRNFMKKTALTTGAVMVLSRGTGFADPASGSSGCPTVILTEKFQKTIWVKDPSPPYTYTTDIDFSNGYAGGTAPPINMDPPPAVAVPPDVPSAGSFGNIPRTDHTVGVRCGLKTGIDQDYVITRVGIFHGGSMRYGYSIIVNRIHVYA